MNSNTHLIEIVCVQTERKQEKEKERDAFCKEFCALWFSATTVTRLCRGTFPALAIVVGNGKFRKRIDCFCC